MVVFEENSVESILLLIMEIDLAYHLFTPGCLPALSKPENNYYPPLKI
jgi:hypothetical protein